MGTKKLLWSGGLDSTFRLLQLVLEEKSQVQPYYLMDETRPSTLMELRTMRAIKTKIIGPYPEAEKLILPTIFYAVSDVAANDEVSKKFHELQKIRHIGTQYDWLARYCESQQLFGLELGVIKKGEVSAYGESLSMSFKPLVIETEKNLFAFDKTKIKTENDQLYFEIFKYYHFPILHLSKKEMVAYAQERGWSNLMELTWFCHKPKNNKPCGKCNPCRTAISEGLGDKIPFWNKLAFSLKTSLGIYAIKKKMR